MRHRRPPRSRRGPAPRRGRRRPSRTAPFDVRFTFDDVLHDLDAGWLGIDWTEVRP